MTLINKNYDYTLILLYFCNFFFKIYENYNSCFFFLTETNHCEPDNKDDGVTYEQMQHMIESVLKQCGYYNVSPSLRERTPPLGPIKSEITNSRHFETPR